MKRFIFTCSLIFAFSAIFAQTTPSKSIDKQEVVQLSSPSDQKRKQVRSKKGNPAVHLTVKTKEEALVRGARQKKKPVFKKEE